MLGLSSTLLSLSLTASSSLAGALAVVVRLRPRMLRVGRPRSVRAVVLDTPFSWSSLESWAEASVVVVLPRKLKRLRANEKRFYNINYVSNMCVCMLY